jgi:hypothetical protein
MELEEGGRLDSLVANLYRKLGWEPLYFSKALGTWLIYEGVYELFNKKIN